MATIQCSNELKRTICNELITDHNKMMNEMHMSMSNGFPSYQQLELMEYIMKQSLLKIRILKEYE